MTERGEGLPRGPKVYRLGEQAQLRRRWLYALHEMRDLDEPSRVALASWEPPEGDEAQAAYAVLEGLLAGADVPESLPRNAASPARFRPRRS